jgi:hypothetical protein
MIDSPNDQPQHEVHNWKSSEHSYKATLSSLIVECLPEFHK